MPFDFDVRLPLRETRDYFLSLARAVFDEATLQRVTAGLQLAEEAHAKQLRGDAEPYIVHPIRTALLVAELANVYEADMWIAALLHDAVEDSPISAERIHAIFGTDVGRLVVALTRVKAANETAAQRRDGKIAKWRATMQADPAVRLLKVCDNIDNVLSWKFITAEQSAYEKIPRWLMEAEELYLPLAAATNEKLFTWMRREIDAYYKRGCRRGTWFSD
jgi:(p)ppGpp synthase/HD superfamily hydrolase